MSRRSDEVQAALHSAVRHQPPVDPGLRVEVILELTVDVVDDGLPAEGPQVKWRQARGGGKRREARTPTGDGGSPVAVVDCVSKAGGVDDGE